MVDYRFNKKNIFCDVKATVNRFRVLVTIKALIHEREILKHLARRSKRALVTELHDTFHLNGNNLESYLMSSNHVYRRESLNVIEIQLASTFPKEINMQAIQTNGNLTLKKSISINLNISLQSESNIRESCFTRKRHFLLFFS